MSGEILLRAEEARSSANQVKEAAEQAKNDFESLKGKLAALADNFRGQAATAWDAKYDEWHMGATQMMDGLDGLGQFLEVAANAIEETDTTLASNLG